MLLDDLYKMLFCMKKYGSCYTFGESAGWERDPCCYMVRLFYSQCDGASKLGKQNWKTFLWENVMKEGAYVYLQLFTQEYYHKEGVHSLIYDRGGDRENRFGIRLAVEVDMRQVFRKLLSNFESDEEESEILSPDEVWSRERMLIQYMNLDGESKPVSEPYPTLNSFVGLKKGYPLAVLLDRAVFVYGVPMMARLGDFGFNTNLSDLMWDLNYPEVDFKLLFPTLKQFHSSVHQWKKNWKITKFYSHGTFPTTKKYRLACQSMERQYPDVLKQWLNLRNLYDGRGSDMTRDIDWPLVYCVKNDTIDERLENSPSHFVSACKQACTDFQVTEKLLLSCHNHLEKFWKLQLMLEYMYVNHRDLLTDEMRSAPENYMSDLGIVMKFLSNRSMREIVYPELLPGKLRQPFSAR